VVAAPEDVDWEMVDAACGSTTEGQQRESGHPTREQSKHWIDDVDR
jgi:hypothetical protein